MIDFGKHFEAFAENKMQQIVASMESTMGARWNNRCMARISEAGMEYQKNRIYDPEHAELKMYDAYVWVYDHVRLVPKFENDHNGKGKVTFALEVDDDSTEIDDYKQERMMEVVDDLLKQSSYSFMQ